jgi:hypothetical protein
MPYVREVCGLLVFVNMSFGLNLKYCDMYFAARIIVE